MAINYVVVLMFENRSFDNLLSALAGPPETQTNPEPGSTTGGTIAIANQDTPTQVDGAGPSYPATTIPVIDPGEYFGDMAQQIFGGASVPGSNPYVDYGSSNGETPTMQGFTLNYSVEDFLGEHAAKTPNIPDVMNYFTPAQVPVTAFLANNYGICAQWFASAPTQTYTNRSFSLCAAPGINGHSLLDDAEYPLPDDVDELVELPSIVAQLDTVLGNGQVNWKIYFHDYSISMLTVPYVYNAAISSSNVNVSTFDTSDWGAGNLPKYNPLPAKYFSKLPSTFLDDIGAGTNGPTVSLAPFTLIEPRYSKDFATNSFPPNSNHPGGSEYLEDLTGPGNQPIDVVNGEFLLALVYNLLVASGIWSETLLIVTYDEHGGTYDHIPPQAATVPITINWPTSVTKPPVTTVPNGNYPTDGATVGFAFNAYGCRVPALVISPFITPGSQIAPPSNSPPFDHTSIIRTVWDVFDLSQSPSTVTSLTSRDAAAPSLVPLTGTNCTGAFAGVIPTLLSFSSVSPTVQTLYAIAAGNATLAASVTAGGTWLSITTQPTTYGTIATLQISVTVTPGTNTGTLQGTITVTGIGNIPTDVPVTLTIA